MTSTPRLVGVDMLRLTRGLVLGGLLLAGTAGGLRAQDEPAAEEPLAEKLKVPQGPTSALVEFLDRVAEMRPQVQTRDELIDWITQTRKAMIEAADRILAAADAEAEALEKAGMAQLEAYRLLARAGVADAAEGLGKLVERLDKLGLKELAQEAKVQVLAARLPLLLMAEGSERQKQYESLRDALKSSPADATHAMLAYQLVQVLDRAGDAELAATACRDLADLYADSTDPEAAAVAGQLQGLGRRVGLVGNGFARFSGKTIDGKSFDLDSLKDKVVLIDFWATWCGPCVAELPNVRRNYDAYHDRGFEVVGVSLDDDRGALERFLAENAVPWSTVLGSDATCADGGQPLSEYYGITSIPTVILIGADGKVLSTHARGEELGRLLAEALGPAEATAGN